MWLHKRLLLLPALAVFAVPIAAFATSPSSSSSSDRAEIVAAESVWGKLAAELAGNRTRVASIVSSPAADPHEYEPTAADARAFAGAKIVIVNGLGYDPWARRLLEANPEPGRIVIDVGRLLGLHTGDNPHRWYSPSDVVRVLDSLERAYARHGIDVVPIVSRLERYRRIIGEIGSHYRGVRVGASESIFAPLAQALGLDLVTPPGFLRALSEGIEPTAADRQLAADQIARREIAVWVVNTQNETSDVQRLTSVARARGIPVVGISELPPPAASFEGWQSAQLDSLQAALAAGRSR